MKEERKKKKEKREKGRRKKKEERRKKEEGTLGGKVYGVGDVHDDQSRVPCARRPVEQVVQYLKRVRHTDIMRCEQYTQL
jgi:hypothetical protein